VTLVLCRRVFLLAPYVRKQYIVYPYLSSGRTYITCSSFHELPTHSTQSYYSVVRHSGKSASTNVSTISTIAVPNCATPVFKSCSIALPLQVSCSTMQLQSSARPQSLPTTHTPSIRRHTQYTLNAHQSPEPPDIDPEIPTNHSWQTVKKRKRTHPLTISATRGHQPPFNSPNSFAELSHLSDDDIQAFASAPHATISSDQAMQPRVHKPPRYMYTVLPTIATW